MRKVFSSPLRWVAIGLWLTLGLVHGVRVASAGSGLTCQSVGCIPCQDCCGCAVFPNGIMCFTNCNQ